MQTEDRQRNQQKKEETLLKTGLKAAFGRFCLTGSCPRICLIVALLLDGFSISFLQLNELDLVA